VSRLSPKSGAKSVGRESSRAEAGTSRRDIRESIERLGMMMMKPDFELIFPLF
jgi:hypothetical protein